MKIFVLDNDMRQARGVVQNLNAQDREIFDVHQITPDTAGHVVHGSYAIALVDRRATDDKDPEDDSGERLAIKLNEGGVPSVVMSSFETWPERSFEYVRRRRLEGIIRKEVLLRIGSQCLEQFRRYGRFPNGFVEFHSAKNLRDKKGDPVQWRALLGKIGKESLPKGNDGIEAENELEVLFRSLFSPCASIAGLRTIKQGQSGAALVEASIWLADGAFPEHLAIKYGTREAITSEAVNYDRHIGPLPDGVAAQIRWRAETAHYAAIAYSWVGDSVEDGKEMGPSSGTQADGHLWPRRHSVIQRLFRVSLDLWHNAYAGKHMRAGSGKAESLIDYYTGEHGMWPSAPYSLRTWQPAKDVALGDLTDVSTDKRTWQFDGNSVGNPLKWLDARKVKGIHYERQAPVHGDLHVRNVFMLPDNSPRLIDFGDTGLGHVFRDFVALEVSIRLTCHNEVTHSELKMLEDTVCDAESLGDYLDYRRLSGDLAETVMATMAIRRAALDAVGAHGKDGVFQEYLLAVVLRMLRYGGGIADEYADEVKKAKPDRFNALVWQALYGAAKAAEKADTL